MSSTGAIPKRTTAAAKSMENKNSTKVIGEPLNEKCMNSEKEGVEWKIPALHKHWASKMTYVRYMRPPPRLMPDGTPPPPGAPESWVEQMEFLEEDLKTLLRLPHHMFWSQMVYDPDIHCCLESYLSGCPRWYEEEPVDYLCEDLVHSLHRLILLIYLRLATPHESPNCHITPSVFAQIIYENFLLDVCLLLDLSVVYGASCGPLLSRMFVCVFQHQPEYYQDLKHTVSTIALALEGVEEKLRVADHQLPIPLDANIESLTETELQELVLFLLDTFSSLHLFLTLHPPAAQHLKEEVNELRIASFYERVIPAISTQLQDAMETSGDHNNSTKFIKQINLMRCSMLAVFRYLLNLKCLVPLQQDKLSTVAVGECVEKFLQIMTTCVAERIFITDYCTSYPINTDIKMFMAKDGDVTSLSFVEEAISTVLREMADTPRVKGVLPLQQQQQQQQLLNHTQNTTRGRCGGGGGLSGRNDECASGEEECASDLAVSVSSVQELFPEMGGGFIQECLKYYSNSAEELINALLEDNLPPSLADLNSTAPLRPTPPTQQDPMQNGKPSPSPPLPPPPSDAVGGRGESSSSLLDERANVYNNDEFDVFTRRDFDRTKIHKGKKATTTKKILYERDEDTITKLKEIGKQYEERGGTSIYEDEFRLQGEEEEEEIYRAWDYYDDEYDDTYDDNETGDIDEQGPEKIMKRRPGVIGAGKLNTHIDYGYNSNTNSDEERCDDGGGEADNDADSKNKQLHHDLQNGPKQSNVKPKVPKSNTRGVQRVFKASSSSKQHIPDREREKTGEGREKETNTQPPKRPGFQEFCENPEILRQRAEERRRDRDYNRGSRGGGGNSWRQMQYSNGIQEEGGGGGGRPKMSSNKHSGKGWRHGDGGDEDRGGYKGGKYKEDTNHGRAQSHQYRHKMMHKNEHKRQGAQAKFNRNN